MHVFRRHLAQERGAFRTRRRPAQPGDPPGLDGSAIDERYLLETFLANTPDHVYFKDAESRFTRISCSLAGWASTVRATRSA